MITINDQTLGMLFEDINTNFSDKQNFTKLKLKKINVATITFFSVEFIK